MGKTIKQKLNKKGFSLVEAMVALAILVFFGSIVTLGINVAMKTYEETSLAANVRILQDDINTAFGTIVRTSTLIEDNGTSGNPELYFRSSHYSGTKNFGKIELDSNDRFYIYSKDTSVSDITDCPLVSPGSYEKMKIKDADITYSNKTGFALITLSYTIYSGKKSAPTYQQSYECSYKTVNTEKVITE